MLEGDLHSVPQKAQSSSKSESEPEDFFVATNKKCINIKAKEIVLSNAKL